MGIKKDYIQEKNRMATRKETNRLKQLLEDKYKKMFYNLFEWQGFPISGNLKYFTDALYYEGRACFKNDPMLGMLTLKNAVSGVMNVYAMPVTTTSIGINYAKSGKTYIQGGDNAGVDTVVLYNTILEDVPYRVVKQYVDRMVDVMMMYDTKIIQAKKPYIVSCGENQKKNLINLMNDVIYNESIVVTSDPMLTDSLAVMNTGVSMDDPKKCFDILNSLDNELKEMLGIVNNKQVDKKERMIVDEVNNNNQTTNLILDSMLEARKLFCKQVNEVFNMNLSVDIKIKEDEQESVSGDDMEVSKEDE